MDLRIETEQEEDGRWIAEVLDIPGALVYGTTKAEAVARAKDLANAAIHEESIDQSKDTSPKIV